MSVGKTLPSLDQRSPLYKIMPEALSSSKALYSGVGLQVIKMLPFTCFKPCGGRIGGMKLLLSGGGWRPKLSRPRKMLRGEASWLGAEGQLESWTPQAY